ADSNPYLVFASVLAGVYAGIQGNFPLDKETIGNAHAQHPPSLGVTWTDAVEKTGVSSLVKDFFGEQFQQCYKCVKESEINRFESTITDFEYHSYLRSL
nr:glutamine synthetase [Candidatus Neomarinimicrobiota bacterium]